MAFRIIRDDITKVKADVIVNTANPDVAIGDGVDSAIYKAAGKDRLLSEREKIGYLAPGEVAITQAFDLDAKYIIHASGPLWEGGEKEEGEILRACYDKALKMAFDHECRSIAFPLLATGSYGFPQRLGIEIAVDSFTRFLEDYDMEIFLVVFEKEPVKISGELGEEVASFIDDEYVSKALKEEYLCDGASEDTLGTSDYKDGSNFKGILGASTCKSDGATEGMLDAPAFKPEDVSFIGKNKSGRFLASKAAFGLARPQKDLESEASKKEKTSLKKKFSRKVGSALSEVSADRVAEALPKESSLDDMIGGALPKNGSLDDVIKGIYKDSFEKHLQKMINKKGLRNSEVYAAANISKQYFSKLLKGQVKPSKEKVLALAVGLRLNMDETIDFLKLAGYALSPISQTDAVVEYFIEHEDYNVLKIDIVLFDYGLDPLSKG